MKNIAALIMLTFLAVTGYYVGAAVAMNHNPQHNQNEPAGVMVMEEEYDVVATPDTQNTKPMTKEHKNQRDQKHNMKNATSGSGTMVVEEVDEMETVE